MNCVKRPMIGCENLGQRLAENHSRPGSDLQKWDTSTLAESLMIKVLGNNR
jgi:hypothetical protein